MSLTELKVGEQATIARIDTGCRKTLNKLMALGILPGMKVALAQKFPSYIIKVGNAQIAADEEISRSIMVMKSD